MGPAESQTTARKRRQPLAPSANAAATETNPAGPKAPRSCPSAATSSLHCRRGPSEDVENMPPQVRAVGPGAAVPCPPQLVPESDAAPPRPPSQGGRTKAVRFDAVRIRHLPRTLGDYDETYGGTKVTPLPYALALDWPDREEEEADDRPEGEAAVGAAPTDTAPPAAIVVVAVDAYEAARARAGPGGRGPRFASARDYDDRGRLGTTARCRALLEGMAAPQLARALAARRGRTTPRAVLGVQRELEAFRQRLEAREEDRRRRRMEEEAPGDGAESAVPWESDDGSLIPPFVT